MKVLVVDDDPVYQVVLHGLFSKIIHCTLVSFSSGSDAYDELKKVDYDIIIIDNHFMGSDLKGCDFWLKMFQVRSENSYIIGCSIDPECKSEFYDNGADFFVVKPFHLNELQTIINSVRRLKGIV